MNSTFKANLIKTLANKKGNKGFTLIELLVVVIIIGVLAAIALPNLLGQVGKARESEAKSTLGAMSRAQQTAFAERGRFAGSMAELEVPVGNEKFYGIFLDAAASAATPVANNGFMGATGINRDATGAVTDIGAVANGQNGTRDYAAGITYDPLNRVFSTVVCRANNSATVSAAKYVIHTGTAVNATNNKVIDGTVAGVNGDTGATTIDNAIATCDTANTEEVK
ncbi:type IV pilin protein [Crocosphaera chwakensis]|uniref:General secretion pathway protein G n=1 Tax=Crocosphaera chwakensis CCY0110 TaxID=391612 RepID=A3IN44_9CHRO|nr:type IV pilin-like G/H family protein [Crocosphaera chwakensis]EAZ92021.1 general secretion pathway protein G [Crocosphaera chwakensis CCY0110]